MPTVPHSPDRPSFSASHRAMRSLPSQMLARAWNEQVYRSHVGAAASVHELEIVCECQRQPCPRRLRVHAEGFDAVRQFPTRFLLRAGHENLEDERVVDEHPGHIVVEKFGPSALAAIRLDPRKR